jgi:hypothetical protein
LVEEPSAVKTVSNNMESCENDKRKDGSSETISDWHETSPAQHTQNSTMT